MTPTAALTWLNDLMQWLGRWVPRLTLIPPTHAGVLFGPRGSVRRLHAGLRVYWPITHELVRVPVTVQSFEPCAQAHPLPLAGWTGLFPIAVVCAVAVQFKVVDPVRAAVSALSVLAVVGNRSNAALARHWPRSLEAADVARWAEAARMDLVGELREFGVEIHRLDIVNVSYASAIKNISDWSYSDRENGERP